MTNILVVDEDVAKIDVSILKEICSQEQFVTLGKETSSQYIFPTKLAAPATTDQNLRFNHFCTAARTKGYEYIIIQKHKNDDIHRSEGNSETGD